MSRSPARFTQAELARAARVAKEAGLRVEIEAGVIRLVEGAPQAAVEPKATLAKIREFRM